MILEQIGMVFTNGIMSYHRLTFPALSILNVLKLDVTTEGYAHLSPDKAPYDEVRRNPKI